MPDFHDRFPLGLKPTVNQIDEWSKGENKEHKLTIDQIPVHHHLISIGHTGINLHNDGAHSRSIGGSTSSVGGGNSFSIMPPYQTIAYITFTGAHCD